MKHEAVDAAPIGTKPQEAAPAGPASAEAGVREAKPGDRVWRRFAFAFLAVFGGVVVLVYVFVILVDPYDSGRFPSLGLRGAHDVARGDGDAITGATPRAMSSKPAAFGNTDESQRTANVALGRAARFNAAIFGNSHGQLLSPHRLSEATGLKFVQLTVPGANVREQIAMMHWFVRHHADIGALVLALDERWCVTDPALPLRSPFPFWLYGDSDLVYLANVLSTRTLRDTFRRVGAAFGPPVVADPTGYADYEAGKVWNFKPRKPVPAEGFPSRDERPFRREPDFPGLILLDALLEEIPATTPVVIVLPPQFHTQLPPSGTGAARFRDYCKWQMALRAERGPGSAFIDFLVDSDVARQPENFMDEGHYRSNVATVVEAKIAGALNGRGTAAEVGHD
jgi:hypothetical protein